MSLESHISADPSHHGHNLFELLPSGRSYRTLYANSFFPQAVNNHTTDVGPTPVCVCVCGCVCLELIKKEQKREGRLSKC